MPFALVENRALRNQRGIFADRKDAGRRLGRLIQDRPPPSPKNIVLAIPSGGVPVGLEISRILKTGMDLMVVRKLQIPGNTEAGFGAMTLDGSLFLNHELVGYLGITREYIEEEKHRVMQELKRRNERFRPGHSLPELAGKEVILADDGLASGFTMLAAAEAVRHRQPAGVWGAVPTAPLRSIAHVKGLLDGLYCLNVVDSPGGFAVAGAYRQWHDLEYAEVIKLLSHGPGGHER